MRARSDSVSGTPSSSVNANRPPAGSARATSSSSASLSRKASIVSSRSTTSSVPGGSGGTCATSKRQGRPPARSRATATALLARVHAEVVAAELARDEPARARRLRSTGRERRRPDRCPPAPRAPGSPTRARSSPARRTRRGRTPPAGLAAEPRRASGARPGSRPLDKPMHAGHRNVPRMLERGATLRAGRSRLADLGKQLGPLAGLVRHAPAPGRACADGRDSAAPAGSSVSPAA